MTFDVHREELLSHPLEELELGTAPASGEEGRRYPRAVHKGSVDVVDYVVEHSQSGGYHCLTDRENVEFGIGCFFRSDEKEESRYLLLLC